MEEFRILNSLIFRRVVANITGYILNRLGIQYLQ